MDYSQRHPIKHILRHVLKICCIVLIVASCIGVMSGFLFSQIPFEYEQRLGDSMFKDIPAAKESVYLQRYADRAAKVMGMEGLIKVHYLDKDEFNAYALFGGHIFVFSPMYKEIYGKPELISMLMAHEIAHVKYRHVAKNTGRLLIFMLGGMFTGNAILALGDMGYSRAQEKEADLLAVDVLYQMYGRIDAAYGLMYLIERYDDNDGFEILSTHPDTEKRIQYIRDYANKHVK